MSLKIYNIDKNYLRTTTESKSKVLVASKIRDNLTFKFFGHIMVFAGLKIGALITLNWMTFSNMNPKLALQFC